MLVRLQHLALFCTILGVTLAAPDCKHIKRGYDSFACVCTANEPCEKIAGVVQSTAGTIQHWESSRDGARLRKSTKQFGNMASNISELAAGVLHIRVTNTKRQEILGFGGAFTDTATSNILKMGDKMAEEMLRDYFSKDGLEYNVGRIPIGGSDFSSRAYSLNDGAVDLSLSRFNLTNEDLHYKIPIIQRAKAMATHDIRLFGSPWSAPAWMKTNRKLTDGGEIQGAMGGEYWQTWAKYFVRYLDAYKSHGIHHWGVTIQNEPLAIQRFNSMHFTPEKQRDFLSKVLGPTLASHGYGVDKLKVMILDHNLDLVQNWARVIYSDKNAAKYASGMGVHWYSNTPQNVLSQAHNAFPDKFILATEACEGPAVKLGSWRLAERYANDIIQNLLNWSIGWTDWNLVLDTRGGPTWIGNYVDAPIIIDPAAKQYYRQPHYYAMGHFSKFIPPGSHRVDTQTINSSNNRVIVAAFKTPQQKTVIVVVNNEDTTVAFEVNDKHTFRATINPRSIHTFVYSD